MPEPAGVLPDKRVQFFTGKGGVGKSTIVAAAALGLARHGRRVVIVELGERSAMAELFGVGSVGHAPVQVAEGVDATKIEFQPALADYMLSRLRLRPLANAVASNRSLQRFFMAAPGVAEIVALHRITELASPDSGYDHVLVDLESTGHALMFFELPRVFDTFLEDGPLRVVLDNAVAVLHDQAVSCVNLVALPEELPSIETRALHKELSARDGLHLGALLINRVPSCPLDDAQLAAVRDLLRSADLDPEVRQDAELAREVCSMAQRSRLISRDLVAAVGLPHVEVSVVALSGLPLAERVSEMLFDA